MLAFPVAIKNGLLGGIQFGSSILEYSGMGGDLTGDY